MWWGVLKVWVELLEQAGMLESRAGQLTAVGGAY